MTSRCLPNELTTSINRGGFKYSNLLTTSKVALYSQTDIETGILIGFDVYIVKWQDKREIEGRILGKQPHDKALGEWAWSFEDLGSAISKFISLL